MLKEPHEVLFEDFTSANDVLRGLARECPKCKVIDHYDVKGRKPIEVECKCGHVFTVQKYKRGERPKAKKVNQEIHQTSFCEECGATLDADNSCLFCGGSLDESW